MTPQFAIELFVYGGAVPAVIACAVAYGVSRFIPRYAAATAFGLAFFVGYLLLPAERKAALLPSRYWHWLPHLAALAMVIGPLAIVRGLAIAERWFLFLLLSVVTAWLLVPTWPDLDPPRTTYVPVLAGYLLLIMAFLDPLPGRISPRAFNALLWLTVTCTTGAVWAGFSETSGRLGALAVAGWSGVCVVGFFRPSSTTARGSVPAFVTVVGGVAFIAFVYPSEPAYSVLALPAAPLALWACALGPLHRLQGLKAAIAQAGVVFIPIAIALTLLFRGAPA